MGGDLFLCQSLAPIMTGRKGKEELPTAELQVPDP